MELLEYSVKEWEEIDHERVSNFSDCPQAKLKDSERDNRMVLHYFHHLLSKFQSREQKKNILGYSGQNIQPPPSFGYPHDRMLETATYSRYFHWAELFDNPDALERPTDPDLSQGELAAKASRF